MRSEIKANTSDYEIKLLEERLLNLSCGALIVKVQWLRTFTFASVSLWHLKHTVQMRLF